LQREILSTKDRYPRGSMYDLNQKEQD